MLQELISSREFIEWKIFFKRNPPRYLRAQYEAASICAMIYNCNKTKGRSGKLQDFLVKFKAPRSVSNRPSPNEVKKKLESWLENFRKNGKVEEK